jgi:hypothetical protein
MSDVNWNEAMQKLALENGGELPKWAWPGGYPLYYVDAQNSALCPVCANKSEYPYPVVACDINWEDPDFYCMDCGERIPSAYAESEPTSSQDRPRLTIDGGISRRTAIDEHGNSYTEFEVDYFAEQSDGECAICGRRISSGWLCLDGGEEYCVDCVVEVDAPEGEGA